MARVPFFKTCEEIEEIEEIEERRDSSFLKTIIVVVFAIYNTH